MGLLFQVLHLYLLVVYLQTMALYTMILNLNPLAVSLILFMVLLFYPLIRNLLFLPYLLIHQIQKTEQIQTLEVIEAMTVVPEYIEAVAVANWFKEEAEEVMPSNITKNIWEEEEGQVAKEGILLGEGEEEIMLVKLIIFKRVMIIVTQTKNWIYWIQILMRY